MRDTDDLPVVNIYSFISFVFLMNDIVKDWMLIEAKRPPPPKVVVPPKETPKKDPKLMSKMEKRLLGANFITEKENHKKSVKARQKEEESRLKRLMERVQKPK